MASPIPDIRINFDGLGLNRIDNDGFETNTTGWSVAAGIQGAGSSITRNTSGGAWEGTARGRLVTTSTSGSGVKFVMSSIFGNGTYRFRVYLKSVSGATTCGIRLGSLGTPGSRATSTFTVTTTWAAYTVDLPSGGGLTDLQANVYTTSAAAMTVDIDAAEVYAVDDDVTPYCDELSFDHGANFEGGLLSGSCTLHLQNMPDDTTIGYGGRFTYPILASRVPVRYDMAVHIRTTYLGAPYGLFYGRVRRIQADPTSRTATVTVADPVDAWGRANEINIATSTTRSIVTFRGLILDALGEPAARRDLMLGEAEGAIPVTGADQASALNLLNSLDTSTATLSYLAFDPSTSVLFKYTTIGRNASVNGTSLDSLGASAATPTAGPTDFIDYQWEDDETRNVTDTRVDYTTRALQASATIWTSPDIPFTVNAGATRTIWANLSDPAMSMAVVYTATNAPTVDLTAFSESGKVVITAGGTATTVSALSVTGRLLTATSQSVTYVSGFTPVVALPAIQADFVPSTAAAQALAEWAYRAASGGGPILPATVDNLFPTIVARQVTDHVSVVLGRVDAVTNEYLIRSIATTVDMVGSHWLTTFGLQRYTPSEIGDAFVLGTSVLGGADLLGL
jgi:hypothetical protein